MSPVLQFAKLWQGLNQAEVVTSQNHCEYGLQGTTRWCVLEKVLKHPRVIYVIQCIFKHMCATYMYMLRQQNSVRAKLQRCGVATVGRCGSM